MTTDISPDPGPAEPAAAELQGGLAAREAALDLVSAALDHRGGLEEAMDRAPFAALELRDRALARMIAMTLMRRLGTIDALLNPRLRKPPPERVMMLLRLGVVQAFYLDTPVFAAVDTTVRLARRDPSLNAFTGLINAVLRGLLRGPSLEADDPEALAPGWLFERWRAAYGEADAKAIAALIVTEPATDLTLRDPSEAAVLAGPLEAETLPGGSLRVRRHGDVAAWPGFIEGQWWVQDAAAAVPARLLAARPGESALDVCAAPGGKTLQLAATGADVVAVDRSGPRLRRLSQSLERTGLTAEVVITEIARWSDPRRFDAVLVDAPCSATGTFRRHPDVLWGTRASDIAKLAGVQARMLDAAADRVAAGGRLVYCVCSMEPEEGEAQVEAFLKRQPEFQLSPIAPGEGGAPAVSATPAGLLRILPHHLEGGIDGFFAARFVRGEG
jgi:16S rRNA (cytosine967-C5)-methyltransferase